MIKLLLKSLKWAALHRASLKPSQLRSHCRFRRTIDTEGKWRITVETVVTGCRRVSLSLVILLIGLSPVLYAGSAKGQLPSSSLPSLPPSTRSSTATDEETVDWRTGKDFTTKLEDRLTVAWERMELGQILADAESTHQLKIWIDRRVDTSQIVNFRLEGVSVGQALSQLANRCGSEVVFMNPLILWVPTGESGRFLVQRADFREQTRQLPAPLRNSLMRSEAVAWPRLSQPALLLPDWLDRGSEPIKISSPLPYDIWAAGQLPPTALVDRILLLSFGFGKHPRLTAGARAAQLEWVDVTGEMSVSALVDSAEWKRSLQKTRDQWQPQFPDVQLERQGATLLLNGNLDDVARTLQMALQPVAQAPAEMGDLDKQRFTLTVSAQLTGAILQTVGQQTGLEVVALPAARDALNQRIDLSVRDATLDQLLQEVATRSGLQIQRKGRQIQVQPGSESGPDDQ